MKMREDNLDVVIKQRVWEFSAFVIESHYEKLLFRNSPRAATMAAAASEALWWWWQVCARTCLVFNGVVFVKDSLANHLDSVWNAWTFFETRSHIYKALIVLSSSSRTTIAFVDVFNRIANWKSSEFGFAIKWWQNEPSYKWKIDLYL